MVLHLGEDGLLVNKVIESAEANDGQYSGFAVSDIHDCYRSVSPSPLHHLFSRK